MCHNGPQITDSDDRKIDFWKYITDEVKSADKKILVS